MAETAHVTTYRGAKRQKPKKTAMSGQKSEKPSDKTRAMARHFGKISRAPLKRQNGSDAWSERDSRVVAGQTAANLYIQSALEKGKEKAKAKRKGP